MSYSGLDTLFQNEGPVSGSITGGQREALAQTQSLMDLQKTQQAYDQAQVMNPLDAQFRQGQLSEQGARLPGEQATSRKLGVEADVAESGKQGRISADRAEQLSKISAAHAKHISDMGHSAGYLGALLEQTPPEQHDAVKQQFMASQGIDPNGEVGQFVIRKGPKDFLDFSNKVSTLRDEYIQHMATTGATNASRERSEKAAIEAGKYKKGTTISYTMKFMSMPIDRQNAEIASAMATGKSPVTGEPMDEDEKASLVARFQQNKATLDAQIAARAQPGVVPQTSGTGGITLQNKPIPQTGSLGGATPALPAGWTMK